MLAFPTHAQALAYLTAFAAGTIVSMAGFSSFIGWLAGRCATSGLKVYRSLMGACAAAAIGVGCFWLWH